MAINKHGILIEIHGTQIKSLEAHLNRRGVSMNGLEAHLNRRGVSMNGSDVRMNRLGTHLNRLDARMNELGVGVKAHEAFLLKTKNYTNEHSISNNTPVIFAPTQTDRQTKQHHKTQ